MSYTPTNWEDAPSTSTPITAAQLNRMDNGIASALSSVSNISDEIDDAEDAIMTKLGNPLTESLESQIGILESNIMDKLGNPQTASLESQVGGILNEIDDTEDAIMTKLGNGALTIDSQLSALDDNIADQTDTIELYMDGRLNTTEGYIDTVRTYLYNSLNTAKNEILAVIESKNNAVKADLLSEMDLKYYDMTNKLSQMKREILKAISTLSDEATGNGAAASHSILITNGFISDSYGFRIPTEE